MNYRCDLPAGQYLSIENNQTQTRIALTDADHGQQQTQANSFQTGAWTHPPALFQTSSGLVLQIESKQGRFYFQLQGSSIHRLDDAPALRGAQTLHLQKVSTDDADSQPAMAPMQPMRPMQMRMGNMHMSMGMPLPQREHHAPEQSEAEFSSRRFCTQCGREAAVADRFCARCGHKLISLDAMEVEEH